MSDGTPKPVWGVEMLHPNPTDPEVRSLVERMRDDAAASGDYIGASQLQEVLDQSAG